jgi:hypothetical protein
MHILLVVKIIYRKLIMVSIMQVCIDRCYTALFKRPVTRKNVHAQSVHMHFPPTFLICASLCAGVESAYRGMIVFIN